jgi:hypothetical protein
MCERDGGIGEVWLERTCWWISVLVGEKVMNRDYPEKVEFSELAVRKYLYLWILQVE